MVRLEAAFVIRSDWQFDWSKWDRSAFSSLPELAETKSVRVQCEANGRYSDGQPLKADEIEDPPMMAANDI